MAYKFRKGVLQTDGVLTGSWILLDGDGTTSGSIAAGGFYGDGSGLTGISAGAAGTDTQVQFNDGGSNLGGDSGLLFTKATNALTVVGDITASYLAIGAAFGQGGLSRGDISGSATLQVVGAAKLGNALAVSGAISSSATSATALAGEGLRLRDDGIISTPSATSLIILGDQEVAIAGNVSASSGGGFEGKGLTIDEGGTIATSAGTLLTLDASTTLVTVAGNLSASGQGVLKGFGIVISDGGTIGGAANTDLLTLESTVLEVDGHVSSSGTNLLKGYGVVVKNGGTIGGAADTDLLTLNNASLAVSGRVAPAAGFGVNYAVNELSEMVAGADPQVLSIGMNTYTGSIGRAHKVTPPAGATGVAGDTVILKVNGLAGNSVMITGSSSSGSIDGNQVIGLSSSYASVTLVDTDGGGTWVII